MATEIDREFKSWWDLTPEEELRFARKVTDSQIQGWEELKRAAYDFGFEPDEDMPTVYELQNMANTGKI